MLARRFLAATVAAGSWLPAQTSERITARGFVLTHDGTPVTGACVVAGRAPRTDQLFESPTVRTDEQGVFELELEASHRRTVTIAAAGRVSYAVALRRSAHDPVRAAFGEVVLPPATTLFGRVRGPDGQPLSGVRVTARDIVQSSGSQALPNMQLAAAADTDAAGIFRLPCVPASGVKLWLQKDGFASRSVSPVSKHTPVDVQMARTATCRGVLLDGNGNPRDGFVWIRYENGGSETFTAGADGVFEFPFRPGLRYRVTAYEGGDRSKRRLSPVLAGRRDDIEVHFAPPTTTPIAVRAVPDGGGDDVASFDAVAHWALQHGADPGLMYGLFTAPDAATGGVLELQPPEDWQPGHGVLHVRAAGHGEVFVPLDARAEPSQLVVELAPERIVRGVVIDERGQPVRGADVWPLPMAKGSIGYGYVPSNAVVTDARGRFELRGLGPYRHTIQVRAARRPIPPSVIVDLTAAAQTEAALTDLRLELPSTVRLVARWESVPDSPGWWFKLIRPPSDRPRASGGAVYSPGEFARSAPLRRGRGFVAPHADRGRQILTAHRYATGRVNYEIAFEVGQFVLDQDAEQTFSLTGFETGVISGRIRGIDDPETLERLSVVATRRDAAPRGVYPRAPVDLVAQDGTFRMEAVPGDYDIAVRDLLTQVELWRAEEPVHVAAGAATTVTAIPEFGRAHVVVEPPENGERITINSLSLEVTQNEKQRLFTVFVDPLQRTRTLLLPTGIAILGLNRAAGALSARGAARTERVGRHEINVTPQHDHEVVLREPPRPTTEALAAGQ